MPSAVDLLKADEAGLIVCLYSGDDGVQYVI